MDKKLEAIRNNRSTYNSGKPCRRGHLSDRYVSNGMCIECVQQRNSAVKAIAKMERAKYVNAMVGHLQARTFMVHDNNRDVVQQLCDTLQYGTPAIISALKAHIAYVYENSPNPKSLNRDDLLAFMDYRDGRLYNLSSLKFIDPTDDNPICYLVHGGLRYDANEVLEVLNAKRMMVVPK